MNKSTRRLVGMNVLMNVVLTICFVTLNQWALRNSFEETFITLALLFGLFTILTNALFVLLFCRK